MLTMNKQIFERATCYIDSWLRYRYERTDLPGFVVAIALDRELLFKQAYGYANLERKEPMTTDHVFRIASHSKTFSATAIMQLAGERLLNIDEPVAKYLPWLNEHRDLRMARITARQLMSHSAGVIRDGLDANFWQLLRAFPDRAEFQREVLEADMVFDNNELMKYSNVGFSLLGLLIEQVSGTPYNDFVQRRILDRLGLSDTGPEYNSDLQARMVTGYSRRGPQKQRLPITQHIDTRAMSAATGFYSTASDMCRYFAAHLAGSGELLDDETKKEMQRTQWRVGNSKDSEEYGLGFAIEYAGTRRLIGHGGSFPGQITRTLVDPQTKLIVIVLTNCIDGEPKSMGKGILAVIDHFFESAEQANPATIGQLRRLQGRFMQLWRDLDIMENGRNLVAIDPNTWSPFGGSQDISILEQLDDTTLRIKSTSGYYSPGELVEYDFGSDGIVNSISYAGRRMLPEADYNKKMEQQLWSTSP